MCGIVGFFTPAEISDEPLASRLLIGMRDRLKHRGPDDGGVWIDPAAGMALGARRLSILDLSSAGTQPILSFDGRYVVAFNGEIYNSGELRADIDGGSGTHFWRGHCDTEVLVEAIARWGVEEAVKRANGMFAIAAWDRHRRELWLVRDRIGKKPLYYGWAGTSFVFASELKALCHHPSFSQNVSLEALTGFLQLGYVLGEQSFLGGAKRLGAGHILRIARDDLKRHNIPASRPYWRLYDVAVAGLEAQARGETPDEDELAVVLEDAVGRRMAADVPIGAFLSGGTDSSLVTSLICKVRPSAVRTFTIGFEADGWDEAKHARKVAAHLGTVHRDHYVSTLDTIGIVSEISRICDEPFADDSIIPTLLLCRMARRDVTVALSGDGGDELFAGYQRYAATAKLLAARGRLPSFVRSLAAGLNQYVSRPLAERLGSTRLSRRLALLSKLLDDGDPARFHQAIMSFDVQRILAQASVEPPCPLSNPFYNLGRSSAIDRMTYSDMLSFLVDDILFKVDRASMSTSLEVRCPLLDHRVIELSWRYPAFAKSSGSVGKLPLRQLLYRYVPRHLVDRPKVGFSAPVDLWLKTGLRDWAESLLTSRALGEHGLLDVAVCRKLWEDFAYRGRGWNRLIWHVLMFQAWYREMCSQLRTTSVPLSADKVRMYSFPTGSILPRVSLPPAAAD